MARDEPKERMLDAYMRCFFENKGVAMVKKRTEESHHLGAAADIKGCSLEKEKEERKEKNEEERKEKNERKAGKEKESKRASGFIGIMIIYKYKISRKYIKYKYINIIQMCACI